MLIALRRRFGRSFAALRRVVTEDDPVLLLGREGRWRWPWLLVGLPAVVLTFLGLLGAVLVLETIALQLGWLPASLSDTAFNSNTVFPFDPDKPLSYVSEIALIWLPLLLAPLIVLRVVHGVSWRRAFSYGVGFRWLDFVRAALALLLVFGSVAAVIYWATPQQHEVRWSGIAILPWIALGLAAVLVQTLAEDVLFLGYLHRTWGAVLGLRLPVALAVIVAFVIPHLANADVQRDMLLGVLDHAIMTAISIAVLLRTQSLGAAAGLHWANNTLVLLRPALPDAVSPLALVVYSDPVYSAGGSYALDPLTLAMELGIMALLAALLLWRRSPLCVPRAPVPVAAAADARTTASPASAPAQASP
jgi:membrane protease YdiL (CAAX protease family)